MTIFSSLGKVLIMALVPDSEIDNVNDLCLRMAVEYPDEGGGGGGGGLYLMRRMFRMMPWNFSGAYWVSL